MGDATGVSRTGIDKTHFDMPTFDKGKLGRHTVAIGVAPSGKASEAQQSAVVLHTEKTSLWERIVNWFTRSLDKEKNMTLVGFIETGDARVFDFKSEKVDGEKMADVDIGHRIHVFESLMLGKTNAGIAEKQAACEVFGNVIEDALGPPENPDLKKEIGDTLAKILRQTKDGNLKLAIIGLQDHLETGRPSGVDIEHLGGLGLDDEDVVGDDYLVGPDKPMVVEDDILYSIDEMENEGGILMEPVSLDSDSNVNDSVDVSGPPKTPMPIESALATLEGKIGEHTLISDMKKLFETGTQPVVVLLEKLEKLYDSPSVKSDDGKKQAVREAAKEIYDKAMHGDVVNSMMYHEQLRVVDALVGLEFKGVHAMRLGEAESPLEL